MTIRTWEEAAHEAAKTIPENPIPLMFGDTQLEEIESYLDEMHEGRNSVDRFLWIADDALQAFCTFVDVTRERALQVAVETIIAKQHDYGHQNILWGGLQGIVLRMHDKVARIRNLEQRGAHGFMSGVPLNEPLADSYLDLVGYSLIGIMLLNGTFELPLAIDVGEAQGEAFVNAVVDAVDDCPLDEAFLLNPQYVITVPSDFFGVEEDEIVDITDSPEPDEYDELTDPTLWHLETQHQHVFVGAWLSGFSDGEPRVGIFTRGKNADGDAVGAYFHPDELGELIAYLLDVSYAVTPAVAVVTP